MTVYGPTALANIALPTGWDAAQLEKERLQDGTSYLEIAATLSGALGALQNEVSTDPLFNMLMSRTSEKTVVYRVGTTNAFERHSEWARPDPSRGDYTGHMLPEKNWDYALDWTWDYLRKADRQRVAADLRTVVDSYRNLMRVQLLSRLLKRSDDSGSDLGLGTGGYSPGFATAAASTSVDFRPPDYQGTTFTTDHEHYNTDAGGAFTVAIIQAAEADLKEHGHTPMFDMLISATDRAEVEALSGFVVPQKDYVVQYESTVRLASQLENFGTSPFHGAFPIGYISDTRVWVVNGWPANYGFMFKSYGMNSPLNPLRMYVPDPAHFLTALQDPRAGNNSYPLNYLMVFAEFGVGVGADRTNGVPIYVGNSTWADGTIS